MIDAYIRQECRLYGENENPKAISRNEILEMLVEHGYDHLDEKLAGVVQEIKKVRLNSETELGKKYVSYVDAARFVLPVKELRNENLSTGSNDEDTGNGFTGSGIIANIRDIFRIPCTPTYNSLGLYKLN